MLQKKKGHVLYHVFFLDYFNVSADRICSAKILLGKKKKRKKNKLPNNPVG